MYFIGVDAGGTKTAFIMSDEKGNILARYESGTGSFLHHGREGLVTILSEGINELCKKASISKDDITYAGFGFPGFGEREGSEGEVISASEEVVGKNKVFCQCDCYIAWAGSMAMKPGINVISGTGAICYGVDEKGNTQRSSGWGAYGDEGSGGWIGGKVITYFQKQSDGRMEKTNLYHMFKKHMGIENIKKDEYFIGMLNREIAASRKEVAKLQILLTKIYDTGDEAAKLIYKGAAYELWLAIKSVSKKLGTYNKEKPFEVSYSGGTFKSGARILDFLKTNVESGGGRLLTPRFGPEKGALLSAMKSYDNSFDPNVFKFID